VGSLGPLIVNVRLALRVNAKLRFALKLALQARVKRNARAFPLIAKALLSALPKGREQRT
jgi:hypothetical protein